DMMVWNTLDGLPSDVVYAISARDNGAWVATSTGLAWVSDSGAPGAGARSTRSRGISRRMLDGIPVYALQAVGDTLWIGTHDGLYVVPGNTGVLSRPTGNEPALRRPI